jgi:hypothetical protein
VAIPDSGTVYCDHPSKKKPCIEPYVITRVLPVSSYRAARRGFRTFFLKKDRLFLLQETRFICGHNGHRTGSGSGMEDRLSFFCVICQAAKSHGLNPFKMLFFRKYGIKSIFSFGVGTISTAEFPGTFLHQFSPSENRSRETYTPGNNLICKRGIEWTLFPGKKVPAGHPVFCSF